MPLVAFSYFSCPFFGRKIECQKHGSTLCNSALEFNKTRLGVNMTLKCYLSKMVKPFTMMAIRAWLITVHSFIVFLALTLNSFILDFTRPSSNVNLIPIWVNPNDTSLMVDSNVELNSFSPCTMTCNAYQ